jgi:hypothetical protein
VFEFPEQTLSFDLRFTILQVMLSLVVGTGYSPAFFDGQEIAAKEFQERFQQFGAAAESPFVHPCEESDCGIPSPQGQAESHPETYDATPKTTVNESADAEPKPASNGADDVPISRQNPQHDKDPVRDFFPR